MTILPPWTDGPFELMVHAESHLRAANDFDKRIALISFDNAIEVAITTYLQLKPIQRKGREYTKESVDNWLKNYHTKLDFFDKEIESREIPWCIEKTHIIWAHDSRNEQYHGGTKGGIPAKNILDIARTSALWIFSVLFDVNDVGSLLEDAVLAQTPPAAPSRERQLDISIDEQYGIIRVGEQNYYTSELLFAVDYNAYRDLGEELCEFIDDLMPETQDRKNP